MLLSILGFRHAKNSAYYLMSHITGRMADIQVAQERRIVDTQGRDLARGIHVYIVCSLHISFISSNVPCVYFSWYTVLTSRAYICDTLLSSLLLSVCPCVCPFVYVVVTLFEEYLFLSFVYRSVCYALVLLAPTVFCGALVGI